MKTNFKINKKNQIKQNKKPTKEEKPSKDLTQTEFEAFVSKIGGSGSFMVFRSDKKDDELGLDEL